MHQSIVNDTIPTHWV